MPFPVAVLAGALVAAALAVPIGYLAVRRTGIYFAMVTLAFAQMIYFIANKWRGLTGGENGLQGVPRELFGLDLTDPYYFYYAALPMVLLGLLGGVADRALAVRPGAGRRSATTRPGPGRSATRCTATSCWRSCCRRSSPGLGGGLFAIGAPLRHRCDTLHWTTSGKAVVMVVLGGIGTLWGGVLGAALLVRLEDWLSFSGFEAVGLVTGGLFVVVVLVFRRGLWGTAADLLRRRFRRG